MTSSGLQQTLIRAATDEAFRSDLLLRRSAAASDAGIVLSDSERAILDGVAETQLGAMIASLPAEPRPVPEADVEAHELVRGIRAAPAGIRPGPVKGHTSRVALIAVGAAAVGGAVYLATMSQGNRPDAPSAPASAPKDAAPPDTKDTRGDLDADKPK